MHRLLYALPLIMLIPASAHSQNWSNDLPFLPSAFPIQQAQNEYNANGSIRPKTPPKMDQGMGAGAPQHFMNPKTGPAVRFPRRCPNGYRWHGRGCHTFGFHDHMLVPHPGGHMRPAKQPPIRYREDPP